MTSQLVVSMFWGIAQATSIGVTACVLAGAARHLAPGHRVWITLTALLMMPVLPVLMLLPLDPAAASVREWTLRSDRATDALPTDATAGAGQQRSAATDPAITSGTANAYRDPDALLQRWWDSVDQAGHWLQSTADGVVLNVTSTEPLNNEMRPGSHWLRMGIYVAMGAVMLGLFRLSIGWLQVRRLTARSTELRGGCLDDLADELSRRLGVSARLQMRTTAELTTPAIVGWRRPVMLLPDDWHRWTHRELHAAIAHELAHVRRRDPLWNATAQLALALSYYHPVAHWLMRRLRLDQELAADRLAAPLAGGRQAYLESLAALALRHTDRRFGGPALTLFSSRRALVRRLQMLHSLRLRANPGASAFAALAGCGLLAIAATIVMIRPSLAQPQDTAQVASEKEPKTALGDLSPAEIGNVLAGLRDYQAQFADETVQLDVEKKLLRDPDAPSEPDGDSQTSFIESLTASMTKFHLATWSSVSDPFGGGPDPGRTKIQIETAFDGDRGMRLFKNAAGEPFQATELCSKPVPATSNQSEIFLMAIGLEPMHIGRYHWLSRSQWHTEMSLLDFLESVNRAFRMDHPELGRIVVFQFTPGPNVEYEWYLKESPQTHIVGYTFRFQGKAERDLRLTYEERDSRWLPVDWTRSLTPREGQLGKATISGYALTQVAFLDQVPDGIFQLEVPEGVRHIPCRSVDAGNGQARKEE